MTIVDWQVSANRVMGTLLVKDPSGFLKKVVEPAGKHAGTITITAMVDGQPYGMPIECYQTFKKTDSSGKTEYYDTTGMDAENKKINFADNSVLAPTTGSTTGEKPYYIYFSTKEGDLIPDTNYTLSVNGYYRSDSPDMTYSREFVHRVFSTDSSGISLSLEVAAQHTLTISADISANAKLRSAKVYLMTPEQSENFPLNNPQKGVHYIAELTLDLTKDSQSLFFGDSLEGNDTLTNSGIVATPEGTLVLESNTQYALRYIATIQKGAGMNSDLTVLSKQELLVTTLKQQPTWQGAPSATYNRVNGIFEVRRPVVTDPDNGAVSYTYTVYDSKGEEYTSRTVTPDTAEPIEFTLPSGQYYTFGVTMKFNDNQKDSVYDLGRTDPVQAVGYNMPSLVLQRNGAAEGEYNNLEATLYIRLDGNSSLQIDEQHPLVLRFYADQYLDRSINLTVPGTPEADYVAFAQNGSDDMGKLWLEAAVDGISERSVGIKLINLFKNTNYTITVSGYVSLNDENEYVHRTIGSVSFRTANTIPVTARWENVSDSTSNAKIRTKLRIIGDTTATTQNVKAREPYAIEQLEKGQITVSLSSGQFALDVALNEEQIAQVLSTGYEITESTFGNISLEENSQYTLKVTSVTDATYNMGLNYTNRYIITNESTSVQSQPVPPALPTRPDSAIKVNPIYNYQRGDFIKIAGNAMDENLSEDAIIGFTLESAFDNSKHLATSVTYYAFEFSNLVNILTGGENDWYDPIQFLINGGENAVTAGITAFTFTRPVDNNETKLDKIAIFFGEAPTGYQNDNYANGYQMYWAGEPVVDENSGQLMSGMGRGYRYIFATSLTYSGASGEVLHYPNTQTAEYTDYSSPGKYGGVWVGDTHVTSKPIYMLQSGLCEAPQVAPDFYTYPEQTITEATDSGTNNYKLRVRYAFRDNENRKNDPSITGLIIPSDKANATEISYTHNVATNAKGSKVLTAAENGVSAITVANGLTWYTITMPYSRGTATLTADVSLYKIFYNDILQKRFKYTAEQLDSLSQEITKIAMNDVRTQYEMENNLTLSLRLDNSTEPDNYFRLIVEGTGMMDFASRAVAIEFTVMEANQDGSVKENTDDYTNVPKTFRKSLVAESSSTTGGQCYARIESAELDYAGGYFVITAAKAHYDTGIQGWNLADSAVADENGDQPPTTYYGFAISEDGEFTGYMGNNPSSLVDMPIPANGRMYYTTALSNYSFNHSQVLPLTIQIKSQDFTTSHLPSELKYQNLLSSTYYAYSTDVIVQRHGVVQDADKMGSNPYVPKKIGVFNMTIAPGAYSSQQAPTPLITYGPNISSQPNSITVNVGSMTVQGMPNTTTPIYLGIFASEQDARDPANATSPLSFIPVELVVDSEGKVSLKERDQDGKVQKSYEYPKQVLNADGTEKTYGLTTETDYWFALYYYKDGVLTLLLKKDGNEADKAVYGPRTLLSDVGVKITEVYYYNNTYFDKRLEAFYTVRETMNLKLNYEIVDLSGNVVVSAAEIDQMIEDGTAIREPAEIERYPQVNKLTLNLRPSALWGSGKLVPGAKYSVKISPMLEDKPTEDFGNPSTMAFEIGAVDSVSTLIGISDIQSETQTVQGTEKTTPVISFGVTISDKGFAVMGVGTNNNTQDYGGVYAVRFVKHFTEVKNGVSRQVTKRLVTEYDDKIYQVHSADALLRTFTLDSTTVLSGKNLNSDAQLDYGTTYEDNSGVEVEVKDVSYEIQVYAVHDENYYGSIALGDKTYTYQLYNNPLFSSITFNAQGQEQSIAGFENWGAAFHSVINSFWDATTMEYLADKAGNESMLADQQKILVGYKEQSPGTSDGISIGNTIVTNRLSSSQIRVEFYESYNMLKPNGEQQYDQIIIDVKGHTSDPFAPYTLAPVTLNNDNAADRAKMIKKETDFTGTTYYYLDVPQNVPPGKYQLTIQFKMNDGSIPFSYSTNVF